VTPIEFAVPAARLLHLAALVAALGALVFMRAVLPPPGVLARADDDALRNVRRRIRALATASLVVSIAGALLWLLAQTAAMAGGGWGAPDRLMLVLTQTRFGAVFSLRLALLLLAAIALRWPGGRSGSWLACLLLAAAILLQPLLGHGAASDGALVPLATAAHVLAASVWLGALFPLWLTLRGAARAGALAARRFSPVGLACVLIIVATAVLQWPMLGDVPRFIGTPYGLFAAGKVFLFAVMLAFAAVNRFVFTPRALAGREDALRAIRVSVFAEALVGVALIGAAAALASLPPAAHEQPVWPFSLRPVPGLWDDAFLRDRIVRTLAPVLAGLALLVAGLLWRAGRWPLVGAAVAAAFWVPSFPLKPYFREAFPTTFQQWERARSPASLQRGAALFTTECASCHAADARGRGPLATGRPVWPPDLTAPLFRRHLDGDLFWRIAHGMRAADGTPSMPAFGDRLTEGDIWMLVDVVRARGSARSLDQDGRWTAATRAPAMSFACLEEGRTVDPARPGDAMLYLAATNTVMAGGGAAAIVADGVSWRVCTIRDEAERSRWLSALAILTGQEERELAQAVVLIDAQGWLRRLWRTPPPEEDRMREARRARQTPVRAEGHGH
jgi:putative copper export protein/mono/diheme cytochrome c family protein